MEFYFLTLQGVYCDASHFALSACACRSERDGCRPVRGHGETAYAGNAADEPADPPASAADAPTPAASSAPSPPAPSTGEDTGSKEGKKESVAHWSPIELAVRALPPLCVVQCCTADTVLLICLSVHRPPLVRGSTRASGGVRVPRLTASTRRPSRTRTSSRRYAAPKEEATAGSALSTPSPSKSGHWLREATGLSRSPSRCARTGRSL